jgi:hypothetical protein
MTSTGTWTAFRSAAALAALSAVLLALSLGISISMLDPWALGLVTVSAGVAVAAAVAGRDGQGGVSRLPAVVLGLGLAASLVHDLLFLPGLTVDPRRLGGFRPAILAIVALLATVPWKGAPPWLARLRFPAVVLAAIAAGAVVILAAPAPAIDVWHIQQGGAEALLDGRNPYTSFYRNIYGPGTTLLDAAFLTPDGQYITAYVYPPLIPILGMPSAALGDVRWTMLLSVAVAALLIWRLGGGSPVSELAGALLLVQPQAFLVLELAWVEPVTLAMMLLALLAVSRAASPEPGGPAPAARSWLLPGVAGALAATTKQYVPLLLVPLLVALPARLRVRALAVAVLGAAAIFAPFVAWGPGAVLRGLVEHHLRQPFREDSLTWPAALVALGGPQLPSWPGFVLAGATLLATVRRSISPGRAALASASTWMVFVLSSKQGHCNYYWLAVGLLCAAAAILDRDGRTGG